MVNFVCNFDNLDGMFDGSGSSITTVPWNPATTKWAPITTLTPTITRNTVFFHTTASGVDDNSQNLITVIKNEAGWDKFLHIKAFTIPTNVYLNDLVSKLDAGDTIEIKLHLNNTGSGKGSIVLALLYTHSTSTTTGSTTTGSTTIGSTTIGSTTTAADTISPSSAPTGSVLDRP